MLGKLQNTASSTAKYAVLVSTFFFLLLLLVNGSHVASYGSEVHIRSISIDDFEPAKSFRTVDLKCPNVNSGILQQIRKDEEGRVAKTRYKYEAGIITKIIDEIADPGKGFRVVGTYKLDSTATKGNKNDFLRLVNQVEPFSESICMNSNRKPLYELIIAINRAQLNAVEYDESPSVKSLFDETSAKFVTIGVRCPRDKDIGVLEHVRINSVGYFGRTRFIYQSGKFTHVMTEAARPGGAWKIEEALYLDRMNSAKEVAYKAKILELNMPLIDNYCQNPDNAKKVDIKIKQYRREHKEVLIESKLDGIDRLKADLK